MLSTLGCIVFKAHESSLFYFLLNFLSLLLHVGKHLCPNTLFFLLEVSSKYFSCSISFVLYFTSLVLVVVVVVEAGGVGAVKEDRWCLTVRGERKKHKSQNKHHISALVDPLRLHSHVYEVVSHSDTWIRLLLLLPLLLPWVGLHFTSDLAAGRHHQQLADCRVHTHKHTQSCTFD